MGDLHKVGTKVETTKEFGNNPTHIPRLSKAVKKANANQSLQAYYDEVNVLVTGFGSINSSTNPNASWNVAKSLPPALPANAAHPTRIRIIVHPRPIAASYNGVLAATTQIFNTYPTVDLVLHLDTAAYGAHYSLLQVAHKAGYVRPDATRRCAVVGEQPDYWNDCRDLLRSSAAPKDVLTRWRSDAPHDTDLRTSTTTTHSLSEYQLYASLAHVQDSSRNRDLEWNKRTMVSSMLMPNVVSSAEDVERAKDIVISLVYALVDSRRFRGSDYDDEDVEMGGNGT